MDLANYKDTSFKVLVNEGESSVGVTLPSFQTSSKPVGIDVKTSPIGKTIVYSLAEAIPDNSVVLVKSIVFYGFVNGARKIAYVSNNLTESVSLDNMYSNTSMKIHIEFEKDGVVYNIDNEIDVDVSKTVELQITEPEIKFISSESLLQAMLTRMQKLENRILKLEKLSDNK